MNIFAVLNWGDFKKLPAKPRFLQAIIVLLIAFCGMAGYLLNREIKFLERKVESAKQDCDERIRANEKQLEQRLGRIKDELETAKGELESAERDCKDRIRANEEQAGQRVERIKMKLEFAEAELESAKQYYENRIRTNEERTEQRIERFAMEVGAVLLNVKVGIGKLDVAPFHEKLKQELIEMVDGLIFGTKTWMRNDVQRWE